jgi:uncharacterized protein YdeI (YjbR/CyaY-like superfamily)
MEPELPKDVQGALAAQKLSDKFQNLPPSHQHEYLKWIGEAKKPAARAARISKMLQMLTEK